MDKKKKIADNIKNKKATSDKDYEQMLITMLEKELINGR